jgi:hypothetical protein
MFKPEMVTHDWALTTFAGLIYPSENNSEGTMTQLSNVPHHGQSFHIESILQEHRILPQVSQERK